MSELDLMIDREIRKAAAGCSGEAILTVIEVAELLQVEEIVAVLLLDDASQYASPSAGIR